MESPKSPPVKQISEIVRDRFENFTKSERRIARYILKNQDEAAFLPASELSERLRLSEATVVRFAQTLGFSGFPEMRTSLQDQYRSRVTHSARIRERLDELRLAGDIFEQMTISEIDFLTQALQTVDRDALRQAVDLLQERKRVFVFGLGPSITLVDLLEIRLTRFGRHVIPLTTAGREVLDSLLLLTADDLMFVIGFFDVTPTLQLILEHAQNQGCPTILLTDVLSPLVGEKADIVLTARRGPVSAFHSLTVPMTIINTLLLSLAQADQERMITNLDRLDEFRDKYSAMNFAKI